MGTQADQYMATEAHRRAGVQGIPGSSVDHAEVHKVIRENSVGNSVHLPGP